MRRLFFLILSIAFIGPGCSKSGNTGTVTVPHSKALTGKWIFAEQKIGNGGPGEWLPVQPANQYVLFKPDSSVNSNVSFLNTATGYSIVDSNRVKFLPVSSPSLSSLMMYKIDSVKGELTLSPLELLCIEGCSYKFRLQK